MTSPDLREKIATVCAETMHGRPVTVEYMTTPATGAHVFWKMADRILSLPELADLRREQVLREVGKIDEGLGL